MRNLTRALALSTRHGESVCCAGSLAQTDAAGDANSSTGAVAFQRLLLEVFKKDINKFREYCLDVEEFAEGVAFLDEVCCTTHVCTVEPLYTGRQLHSRIRPV